MPCLLVRLLFGQLYQRLSFPGLEAEEVSQVLDRCSANDIRSQIPPHNDSADAGIPENRLCAIYTLLRVMANPYSCC